MRFSTLLIFLVLFLGIYSQNFLENTKEYKHDMEIGRKKKKTGKYVIPLIFSALLIKSIIFPLAFKAMAVMTSIAVLLSVMGLIVSSIVGYAKLAWNSEPSVKVFHVNNRNKNWAKDDSNLTGNYYGLEAIDYHIPYEQFQGK